MCDTGKGLEIWGHEVTEDTLTEIGRFAVAWSAFENYYFKEDCNVKNLKEITIRVDVDEKITSPIRDFIVEYRKNKKINIPDTEDWVILLNMRDNEDYMKNTVNDFLEQKKQIASDKVKACIFIAWRIRNNSFHGIKNHVLLNGQKELFTLLGNFLRFCTEKNVLKI